jgi:hypothetical protein
VCVCVLARGIRSLLWNSFWSNIFRRWFVSIVIADLYGILIFVHGTHQPKKFGDRLW